MTTLHPSPEEVFEPSFEELFKVFSAVHDYPTDTGDIFREVSPIHLVTVSLALDELEELGLIKVHHESELRMEWRLS